MDALDDGEVSKVKIYSPQLMYIGLPHLHWTISSVVASPKSVRNT